MASYTVRSSENWCLLSFPSLVSNKYWCVSQIQRLVNRCFDDIQMRTYYGFLCYSFRRRHCHLCCCVDICRLFLCSFLHEQNSADDSSISLFFFCFIVKKKERETDCERLTILCNRFCYFWKANVLYISSDDSRMFWSRARFPLHRILPVTSEKSS